MMLRSEEYTHLPHSLKQTIVGDPLDLALAAFREDLRAGCVKSILYYEERFPEVAVDLRELIPSVAALEHASAHSMDQILRRNTPQRIGNYEITAEIGRGGMAVVYEARDPKLGRTVALKVLPYSSGLNQLSVLRFRNEAQILAQIDHPNIVPVYDTGEHNGASYLAMKRIRGMPLDDIFTIAEEGSVESDGDSQIIADQMAVPAEKTRQERAWHLSCPALFVTSLGRLSFRLYAIGCILTLGKLFEMLQLVKSLWLVPVILGVKETANDQDE